MLKELKNMIILIQNDLTKTKYSFMIKQQTEQINNFLLSYKWCTYEAPKLLKGKTLNIPPSALERRQECLLSTLSFNFTEDPG